MPRWSQDVTSSFIAMVTSREMVAVAAEAPELAGESARRADAALELRVAPDEFDTHAARKIFAQMMGDDRTAPQRKIVS